MSFGDKCHLLVFLDNASQQLAKFLDFDSLNESSTNYSHEDLEAQTIVALNPFDENKPFLPPGQYKDLFNQQNYLQNHLHQELENRNNGFYRISATVLHIDPNPHSYGYQQSLPTLVMAPLQTQSLHTGYFPPVESYSYPIGQQNQSSLFKYNSSS